jgi:predicted SnoaL-like aldol condensation-catalyzing enzyme
MNTKRAPGVVTAVAAAAATLCIGICGPAAASNAVPASPVAAASARTTAANKALVTYVYDQLFNHANTSVIDRYVRSDYIQHNPTVANGPDALRQLVETLHANNPDSRNIIEHVVAQDDLVLLQSDAGASATFAGVAIVDVFRVQDGKIAEHWDTIQPVPDTTVSGHDMFSTLSRPATATPSPSANTAGNEAIALPARPHDCRRCRRHPEGLRRSVRGLSAVRRVRGQGRGRGRLRRGPHPCQRRSRRPRHIRV